MKPITFLLLLITGFAYADPIITSPSPYEICDDNYDGISCLFDLHFKDVEIIMGQPNIVVSYHETLTDAQIGANAIPNGLYCNISPSTQTIYVRATDTTDGSFATTTLNLIVDSAPIANTPPNILQEDIPFDGHATFDLTVNENIITSGATGVSVFYFLSLLDAQAFTNPLATPTTFVNDTNPQNIYVRVDNNVTGCYNITSFEVIVTNPDIVFIPDPYFKAELVSGSIATDAVGSPVVLDANADGEIQLTEALAAYRLDPINTSVSSYEGIQSFQNLRGFYLPDGNLVNSLDVSGMQNLKDLHCETHQLHTLNITNCQALERLYCGNNYFISTLDLTGKPNLISVWCEQNQIASLDVTGAPLLQHLSCRNNLLSTLDISNNIALTDLNCGANPMTSLDISHNTNLINFHCAALPVSTLDFTGLNNILNLNVRYTNITSLDTSNMPNLVELNCDGNLFTELDLSHNPSIAVLWCSNSNSLTHLNLKNGNYSFNLPGYFNIQADSNLQFVCVDDEEVNYFENYFNGIGSSAVVNSYCDFTPGGNYNTITGHISFDSNGDGCDASDPTQSNIRINITDGTNTGAAFDNSAGDYTIYTQAGDFTLTPDIENPSWFTFTPNNATISFPDNNNNTATQNFCVAPNGIHRDAEMVIAPIGAARPGFDATYKLVYKNKGNQTSDLYLNFTYDDNVLDFVAASDVPTLATTGHLSWTVPGVLPFQSGYVLLTLHLNSPTDTPPVNIGDVLTFDSFVDITTDENWADNAFTLNQTVIGSFDPNSITCLEGDSLPVTEIGNYLHYGIMFENTGNYAAENVVVKDVIDTDKYDINSLQVLETSHPSNIKITGNTVEFVFQNINLAAASGGPPVGGHGDVLFKIKSNSDLVNGDYVSKSARIYFDYNAPIMTNDAQTTFATLNNPIHDFDNSVRVYPNPAVSLINISCDSIIQSVSLYDIQGRLLETDLTNSNEVSFDISCKTNGVYFIKITSDKGSKVEKIVKK